MVAHVAPPGTPRRVEYQLASDDNHRNAPLKRNVRIKYRWANCYIIAYLIQPQYK